MVSVVYVVALFRNLYHDIENTANQNSEKPLYIRQYSTQPSHRALRILFPPNFEKQRHILLMPEPTFSSFSVGIPFR